MAKDLSRECLAVQDFLESFEVFLCAWFAEQHDLERDFNHWIGIINESLITLGEVFG
jgi:hypothetical protein